MKRQAPYVAAVHDLSGVGRCALTIVLPVLSAMGCQCAPLPTAYLSASTIYPPSDHFVFHDLTDEMEESAAHWGEIGIRFDAIYGGFLGSERQLKVVGDFIRRFRGEKTLVMLDPVMGDHGKAYRTYTPEMCRGMVELTRMADVITPNMTEAAILLEEPYDKVPRDDKTLREWMERLSLNGRRSVILTGVEPTEHEVGAASFDRESGKLAVATANKEPAAFPGTGDLFSSVALGSLLRGDSLEEATALAVRFVGECARHTLEVGTPIPQGVQFEDLLRTLC